MLNQMRSGAGNFAAKVLLALLVASFAVWGIGDMVRRPNTHQAVATVGGTAINQAAFQQALQRETDRVRSTLGSQYSPEMVAQLRLPEQVLSTLIKRELVIIESTKLGLIPSDADIMKNIRDNPAFRDVGGKFSKDAFMDVLRRNRMSEKDYIAQLRQTLATRMLMEALASPTPVSDTAITTLYRALEERRTVTLYTLAATAAAEPDTAAIETYYKEHASEFSTPEYRKLSYLTFKADAVQKQAKVSEDMLRTTYEERKEEFKRPERRTVEQLLLTNEAEAKKAAELIAAGKSMTDAAKATGKKPTAMGNVERDKLPGEAADAVFALEPGKSTDVIKSAFGWHIFHVSHIVASGTLPFEEVRGNLEADAKAQASEEALSNFNNQIDDALAAGNSLADIAKDKGLTVVALGTVDASGKTPDGKAATLPDFDKFLDVAFKTEEKTESPVTLSKGGVYYIVRVESITPSRLRTLDEVKAQATAGARAHARATAIATMADQVASAFADAKTRSDTISKYGLQASTVTLKRSDDKHYPTALLADIFSRRTGESTDIYPTSGSNYLIAVMKERVPSTATPPAETRAQLLNTLKDSAQNERVAQYLAYLEKKHGVSINETALNAITKE